MKTKLLFTFLCTVIFTSAYSQIEASNYLANLIEPSGMVNQGTTLYVQGLTNLYQINTTAATPAATSIYTPAANYYMSNLAISGNLIYISEEHYDVVEDESLGCRIVTLDLNNLTAAVNVIYTTTQYISSLAIKESIIYFASETTPDANDNYTVQIHKIDSSIPNPTATILVSNLCANKAANDMAFHNNNLLISVGGLGKLFGFDITDSIIVVSEYMSNLNFNKGLFVTGSNLFLTEGNQVGTKPLNVTSTMNYVAKNTFYQDVINGNSFNANFRDVVLIGDKLYMTLLTQGRVVTVQDATLSTNEFNLDSNTISVYNSKTELVVSGLENNQTATVYNLSGQLLITKNVSANQNSIDISGYPQGLYLLKLDNQNVFKFIK